MRFSILIPVYNAEAYLKQCIDSVLIQTYQDYEVIFIDDDSTDQSLNICQSYEKNDKRIHVFTQTNQGAGAARNNAYKKASGDFVLFLDSDDYWNDSHALEHINSVINEETDIVVFGYQYLEHNQLTPKSNWSLPYTTLTKAIDNELYTSSACLKAIKLSFLEKNHILFDEGCKTEDISFNLKLLLYTDKIIFMPESFYIYRLHEGSNSSMNHKKAVIDYCKAVEECIRLTNETDRHQFDCYTAYQYAILLGRIAPYKDLMNEMKTYQWLLKKSDNKKVKIISFLKTICGYQNTCRIVSRYLNR